MKKLLLSLLICMGITMISSQTYAQLDADGAKLKPFVGNTYDYTFTGITPGLKYQFYFSPDGLGKGSAAAAYDAYLSDATIQTVQADGEATVSVTWPSNVPVIVGKEVFLFVKVYQEGSVTTCDNYNAVSITPIANDFNIALVDNATDSETCPEFTDFDPVIIPDSYNAGKTSMQFTITRSGLANAWNLKFKIERINGTGEYMYSTDGSIPTIVGAANTPVELNNIAAGTDDVVINLLVNNVPGDTPEYKITVTEAKDVTTGVKPLTYPAGKTHKIKIMPVIGTFQ